MIRDADILRLVVAREDMLELNRIETDCIDAEVGEALKRQDDLMAAINRIAEAIK